jgi:LacI family transcriptional regulator
MDLLNAFSKSIMLKIKDIALNAGVSPTTVSFVLNDRGKAMNISEKTRNKVLRAAEEMGYRSNHLARAMRTGDTRMLGLLGGKTSEEQVGRMLEGALEAADSQGYTLKLLRLDAFGDSAQAVIRRSSELRLMGMMALHLPEPVLEELHAESRGSNTPLVLLDARCPSPDIVQVVSDDEGGITAAFEHLVQLGHSRIAYMHVGGESTLGSVRKQAFHAARERHGLMFRPDYITEGSFRFCEPSANAARALLTLPKQERPTAILCASDTMALATLQVAHELSLRVPDDLSVVGFANMSAAEFAAPALTTVEQPFFQMGRAAVETLLSMIKERQPEGEEPHASPQCQAASNPQANVRVLPTQLIERATTAPPPSEASLSSEASLPSEAPTGERSS